MPNWCYNRLQVFGGKDEIEKFKKSVKTKENGLIKTKHNPLPQKVLDSFDDKLNLWK